MIQPAGKHVGGESGKLRLVRPKPAAKPIDDEAKAEAARLQNDAARLKRRIIRLEQLLAFEAVVRGAENLSALRRALADEAGKVIPAEQVIVWSATDTKSGQAFTRDKAGPPPSVSVDVVSSIAVPDANAPLVKWLSAQVADCLATMPPETDTHMLELAGNQAPGKGYPFQNGLLVRLPLTDSGSSGFLMVSRKPFREGDAELGLRMAGTLAHAVKTFRPHSSWLKRMKTRRNLLAGLAVVAILLCIPVPMSILAPAEVIARGAMPVTMPMEGVIAEIMVDQNQRVQPGDLLIRLEQSDFVNHQQTAEQELAIAMARYRQANQGAFDLGSSGLANGKRDGAILAAEVELAKARLDHARQNLVRTEIRADVAGIAIYSSRSDWLGRPVATGERMMEIANPRQTELRVDIPTADAIPLADDASVRFFSETDPLDPVAARPVAMSYKALPTDAGPLAFRLTAVPLQEDSDDAGKSGQLRIGERGTAQVTSGRAMLGYYLFRKPLSKLRQWTGL